MTQYERYKIAFEKAKELEKLNMPALKKQEIYSRLGKWINTDKTIEELPFPFGKTRVKI